MKVSFKSIWQVIKDSGSDFATFRITRMSAALAYYTVFSIAPLLILVISLSAVFYGKDAIQGSIQHELTSFVGQAAAGQIQDLIKNASISKSNVFASTISIIVLIIGATSVFGEIQDSINLIWGLKAKPKSGILKLLINRLLSFSIIVSLSFILIVSLLVSSVLDILSARLTRIFPEVTVYLVYAGNILITLIVITFLFGAIFKVLPDAKIRWRDVITGAITTALLFMLGKFGISFYLGKKNIGSTYGAAGSIIVILLWVYYSSLILYFGAAFTKNYALCRGRRIYPNDYAVFTEIVEKEKKGALEEKPAS